MDAQPAVVTLRFNKFLPYWAVLQTDLRQTLRSWVYRLWVLMTVLAAAGFLLYRVGVHTEAGIVQSARPDRRPVPRAGRRQPRADRGAGRVERQLGAGH